MKQITLPQVALDIQQVQENVRTLVITEIGNGGIPGDVYIIPMPNDIAEEVGRKLAAPSIQRASASDLKVIGGN